MTNAARPSADAACAREPPSRATIIAPAISAARTTDGEAPVRITYAAIAAPAVAGASQRPPRRSSSGRASDADDRGHDGDVPARDGDHVRQAGGREGGRDLRRDARPHPEQDPGAERRLRLGHHLVQAVQAASGARPRRSPPDPPAPGRRARVPRGPAPGHRSPGAPGRPGSRSRRTPRAPRPSAATATRWPTATGTDRGSVASRRPRIGVRGSVLPRAATTSSSTTCCDEPRGRGSSTTVPTSRSSPRPISPGTLPGPVGRATLPPRHAPSASASGEPDAGDGRCRPPRQREARPRRRPRLQQRAARRRRSGHRPPGSPAPARRAQPGARSGSPSDRGRGQPSVTRSRILSSWALVRTLRVTSSSREPNGCSVARGDDLLHCDRADPGQRVERLGAGRVQVDQPTRGPAAARSAARRRCADDRHHDLLPVAEQRREVDLGGRGREISVGRITAGRRDRVRHARPGGQLDDPRVQDRSFDVNHQHLRSRVPATTSSGAAERIDQLVGRRAGASSRSRRAATRPAPPPRARCSARPPRSGRRPSRALLRRGRRAG